MKKRLILTSFLILSLSIFAQEGETPMEGTQISAEILNELNRGSLERLNAAQTDREAINGWVSFELTEYNYTYGEDAFFTYGQVISPDTLPRVSFTGGTFRSFTHGFGQIFDPTAEDMELSEARLTAADSYEIDSIGFPSFYRRVNHNDIDDTLIITVAITDKKIEAGNPYDGSFFWSPGGLLATDTYVMSPSYAGNPAHGNHHGLTGTNDPSNNVEIQQYKFALTEDDTEVFWRSFPVNIVAGPDQVIYTFVEFQTSFEATIEDTAFVFDGALGEANTNSFRTIYDFPVVEQTGYFFDLYRDDQFSHNASYVVAADTRYAAHTGDNEWRNDRLEIYSWWGFRFEYFMNATSSVSVAEEEIGNKITISPNPTALFGETFITLNIGTVVSGHLEIHDMGGRLIHSLDVENKSQIFLNLERFNIKAGTYILSVQNDDGILKERFVIQ
ncbi:MAG: hypothetical protein ACI8ZM_002339 [Crocinitomix sp.]|jgi:hypothetical protein